MVAEIIGIGMNCFLGRLQTLMLNFCRSNYLFWE